jgi:hypothetical protein
VVEKIYSRKLLRTNLNYFFLKFNSVPWEVIKHHKQPKVRRCDASKQPLKELGVEPASEKTLKSKMAVLACTRPMTKAM